MIYYVMFFAEPFSWTHSKSSAELFREFAKNILMLGQLQTEIARFKSTYPPYFGGKSVDPPKNPRIACDPPNTLEDSLPSPLNHEL